MKYSKIIRVFCFILLFGLYNQGNTQVAIMLHNRSSAPVDSVVIKAGRSFNMGKVDAGSSRSIFVSVDQANFHSFAPFDIYVYSPILQIRQQWQKTGFTDTLYFFNHGLTKNRLGPQRPETFNLFVENFSASKIDAVFTSTDAVIHNREMTPRSFEVKLNHQKMDSDQMIIFRAGDKMLSHDLKYSGLNDWNTFHSWVYITDDSVYLRRPSNAGKFEYVIEFEMLYGEPLQHVQPKSQHLLKTYVEREGRLTRAVFDYAGLQANPQIEVWVGKKKHILKLNETDFDGSWDYIHFQISRKGMRRG